MKIKRVYVAGPYTKGDVVVNVRRAVLAGNELRNLGFTPFVPHLYHLWHTICPRPWGDWMALDMEWLEACDALLRLPGESKGADMEVLQAMKLEIPVFYEMTVLVAAANK